jgi:hypothetical protein
MPLEYYLGAAVALILLVLLASLFRRWLGRRHNSTDQLTNQLSRIADALEKMVVHLGASPPAIAQSSPPPREASNPSDSEQGKSAEPTKSHVSLSMFGR